MARLKDQESFKLTVTFLYLYLSIRHHLTIMLTKISPLFDWDKVFLVDKLAGKGLYDLANPVK